MKTRTMLLIVSGMIVATVIVGAIAIVAILLLGNSLENTAATNINADDQTTAIQQQTTETSTQPEFVYLQSSDDSTLIRVNTADSSSQNYALALSPNLIYVSGTAFSDDGRLVGFCSIERLGSDATQTRFVVRDIEQGINLLEEVYENLPICQVSAFSPDSSQVAVGFIFNSIIEGSINYPDHPNWALRILNVTDGSIVHELNADSPNAPDYESMTDDFWFSEGISPLTRVVEFTASGLYYNALPYVGRDGPLEMPAHFWDFASDTVTPVEGLTKFGSDFLLETGEIVYPELDETIAAAQPPGPMPQANTVRLRVNGETSTIYRNTEEIIASARFINGGQQIAIMLVAGTNQENPQLMGQTRYEIIHRDGTTGFVSSSFAAYNELYGTVDGFILLNSNINSTTSPTYTLSSYHDGEMSVIWTHETVDSSVFLAWVPPMPVTENLPPFATID